MDKNKRKFIGLTIFSTAISVILSIGLAKLFPRLMKKCKEKCEAGGFEPPALCKKIMDRCCPDDSKKSGR
ncbi:MAG: hypothetical protein ABID35_03320 [Candidatus Margulisiibacteriota bacterium]